MEPLMEAQERRSAMAIIQILDPTAVAREVAAGSLSYVEDVRGKVVGFVSNEWPSLLIIWERLQELLPSRFGVAETFKVTIPVSRAAPEPLLDDVARRSHVALVGFAN